MDRIMKSAGKIFKITFDEGSRRDQEDLPVWGACPLTHGVSFPDEIDSLGWEDEFVLIEAAKDPGGCNDDALVLLKVLTSRTGLVGWIYVYPSWIERSFPSS